MTATSRIFLYGTLLHPPLLEAVAGHRLDLTPAALRDHAVWRAEGGDFPVIVPETGKSAQGALIDVDETVLTRLNFYEEAYRYRLEVRKVETPTGDIEASVYFAPDDAVKPTSERWSLGDWAEGHGALTVEAAAESMEMLGRHSALEMGRRYPRIRARAWSRMLASSDTGPRFLRSRHRRDDVAETRAERLHSGFFAFDRIRIDHPRFDGGRSGPVEREVFIGTDAALVLPYDPATRSVLLVEQFRSGPYLRGDPRPWALEPVAGLVDAGEHPAETARREAVEEAGIAIDRLIPVSRGYPSPGATTEYYHCFIGLCDLTGAGGSGGLDSEDEDIWAHVLPLDDAAAMIGTGEITVIPLAMLLLWLVANREGLQADS